MVASELAICPMETSMVLGRRQRKKKRQGAEEGGKEDEDRDQNRSRNDEQEVRQDPLEVFGVDLMTKILGNLDARSVAPSLLVSGAWYAVASSDRLWSPKVLSSTVVGVLSIHVYDPVELKALPKCEELWYGKAHIPRASQVPGLSKLAAYSISVKDGKRTRIMKEDLCNHDWEFHFNEGAPEFWRNMDPYWKGTGPLMRRYFHPDGSLTAGQSDKVWGGHECCYTVVTSFTGENLTTIRKHYVRINRWPEISVFRNPDWSWKMCNLLYCYNSVPDSDKEGGTGPFPLP